MNCPDCDNDIDTFEMWPKAFSVQPVACPCCAVMLIPHWDTYGIDAPFIDELEKQKPG